MLRNWQFRGKTVVGLDVEKVHVIRDQKLSGESNELPYEEWPDIHRNVWSEPPTHYDFPGSYAKALTLAGLYGTIVVLDLGEMTMECWQVVQQFLADKNTIVVTFAGYDDLWSINLSRGDRNASFGVNEHLKQIRNKNETERRQKRYQAFNIMRIRIFDLQRAMQFAHAEQGEYSWKKWFDVGILPEGGKLYHLAAALLGIDPFPYDVDKNTRTIGVRFNVVIRRM